MTDRLLLAMAALVLLAGCGEDPAPSLRAGEADHWAHPVSHILIDVNEEGTNEPESRRRVYEIYARLVEGGSFADVARRFSEHDSKVDGGFLGFVPIAPDTRFSGAVQAISPGETSRPVRTDLGYQIIHRHTLAEGVALEKKYFVSIYGFVLRYKESTRTARYTRVEAEVLAKRIHDALLAGKTTLEEARKTYAQVDPRGRDDAFVMLASDRPDRHDLYEQVRAVEPGAFVEPFDTQQGIAVVQRGQLVRGIVRHILVRHRGSAQRPLDITRSRSEALELARQALTELNPDKSNWNDLVQKYTDDDTRVRPAGTVGIVGPGEMPRPVEDAMAKITPGEVYPEVVETLFGFHVLWRVR